MGQERALMKTGLLGAFLFLIISSTASGLGSVVSKWYTYIIGYYTWEDAQDYCKRSSYYTDLAVFYSQSDVDGVDSEHYLAWIGLHNDTSLLWNDWVWSNGGEYEFTLWGKKPKEGEECAAVDNMIFKGWGQKCSDIMFFICHKKKGKGLKYTFIPEAKTWSEAQQYCRENYDDLASVADSDLSTAVDQQDFPVWIGLRRTGETWNWSTGFSNYSNWELGEPGNSSDCASMSSVTKKMSTQNCNGKFPFICISENVVLIREDKTWEEALEHCRGLTSPTNNHLHFELLSLQPSDDHDYLMSKMLEANTEEVWTGLRFLAGEWLWVNGADMLYTHLPPCPILGHHCGALPKKDISSLEARDCLERKKLSVLQQITSLSSSTYAHFGSFSACLFCRSLI